MFVYDNKSPSVSAYNAGIANGKVNNLDKGVNKEALSITFGPNHEQIQEQLPQTVLNESLNRNNRNINGKDHGAVVCNGTTREGIEIDLDSPSLLHPLKSTDYPPSIVTPQATDNFPLPVPHKNFTSNSFPRRNLNYISESGKYAL